MISKEQKQEAYNKGFIDAIDMNIPDWGNAGKSYSQGYRDGREQLSLLMKEVETEARRKIKADFFKGLKGGLYAKF